MVANICTVCGSSFYGRADALTCSSACRQRAYRDRNRPEPSRGPVTDRLPSTVDEASAFLRRLQSHLDRLDIALGWDVVDRRAGRVTEAGASKGSATYVEPAPEPSHEPVTAPPAEPEDEHEDAAAFARDRARETAAVAAVSAVLPDKPKASVRAWIISGDANAKRNGLIEVRVLYARRQHDAVKHALYGVALNEAFPRGNVNSDEQRFSLVGSGRDDFYGHVITFKPDEFDEPEPEPPAPAPEPEPEPRGRRAAGFASEATVEDILRTAGVRGPASGRAATSRAKRLTAAVGSFTIKSPVSPEGRITTTIDAPPRLRDAIVEVFADEPVESVERTDDGVVIRWNP